MEAIKTTEDLQNRINAVCKWPPPGSMGGLKILKSFSHLYVKFSYGANVFDAWLDTEGELNVTTKGRSWKTRGEFDPEADWMRAMLLGQKRDDSGAHHG